MYFSPSWHLVACFSFSLVTKATSKLWHSFEVSFDTLLIIIMQGILSWSAWVADTAIPFSPTNICANCPTWPQPGIPDTSATLLLLVVPGATWCTYSLSTIAAQYSQLISAGICHLLPVHLPHQASVNLVLELVKYQHFGLQSLHLLHCHYHHHLPPTGYGGRAIDQFGEKGNPPQMLYYIIASWGTDLAGKLQVECSHILRLLLCHC